MFLFFIVGEFFIFSRFVLEGLIIGILGIFIVIIIDNFSSILEYINQSREKWKKSALFWLSVVVIWSIYLVLVYPILFAYIYFENYFEFLSMMYLPYIYIILLVTFVQYRILILSGENYQTDIKYDNYLRGKFSGFALKLFLIFSYSYFIVALSFTAIELFIQFEITEIHINAFAGGFVGALLSFLIWLLREDIGNWNKMTPYLYLNLVFVSNTIAYLFSFIYVFLK